MTQTIARPETGTWTIDPAHSSISLVVKHLMASKVRGSFTSFSGAVEQGATPEATSVTVTIDAESITTGVADRDAHIRSGDFLDTDNYPTLTFKSTSISKSGDGFSVTGDLTIRNTTKPVTIEMTYGGLVTDPWGNSKAIFSGTTKIDREDFGLTWNQVLETGGWLVGKTITTELEIQATKA